MTTSIWVRAARMLRSTRRAATRVALGFGLIGSGLAVMAMPASANVVTGYYTIGAPTGAVGSVAATPSSVAEGASTGFGLTFTAVTGLSGGSNAWLSIAPSVSLSSAPVSVDVVDMSGSSCFQAGTAGQGGVGSSTQTQLTIELVSSCTINAGDKVQVDFNASAPSATGSFDFSITTSANNTSAASNSISVTATASTLTATTVSYGANTTYTMSNVPVQNVTALATRLVLQATPTQGSATIAFYGSAAGYTVTYTPSGGTATADPVQSAVLSGPSSQIVTLTLANPVASGGALTITAVGTNPPAGSGTEANDITITPGNGTPFPTSSIVFGNSVNNVTVSPSTLSAGSSATYTVSFRASSTVNPGSYIFLSEPEGPTNFASVTGILVTDGTHAWQSVASGAALGSGAADVPVASTIYAGDSVTLTLANVTNPPARTISDFGVSTTTDSVVVDAPAYTVGTGANSSVVVTVSPATGGAVAQYTIANLVASASMQAGSSTVQIEAPSGTILPGTPSEYSLEDLSAATGSGVVSAAVVGGGTNNVTVTVPANISAGDHLAISVGDVINPSTASSTYAITLLGNVAGPSGASVPAFPHADVTYPNGGIVSFGGTDYVFAGGHAFALNGASALAALRKVDHATVLMAASGATPPSAAPRPGTLVFTRPVNGAATIYVVGTDGQLHGFATPAQFTGDGYDPALVVTVASIAGLQVGSTAGQLGQAASALSTSADGAIVQSGSAYYVLAGGHAFGVPTPTSLRTIEKSDKAKVLKASITASQSNAAVPDGVLFSAGGPVYVSYSHSLWLFKSLSQLSSDGYGGTAAVTVPGTGGLALSSSYVGS